MHADHHLLNSLPAGPVIDPRIHIFISSGLKKLLLYIVFTISALYSWATHNRAGEISYRHLGGHLFEITVTTYTDPNSIAADRCELRIEFGDGDFDTIPRINDSNPCDPNISCDCDGEILTSLIKKNIYRTTHNYRGPGIFNITVEDPNRVENVVNMPGSVNIPFFIRTVINISPLVGFNNSVELRFPPIDHGCVGKPYYHNPGAFDIDGDSLSYQLTECLGLNGNKVTDYHFPNFVIENPPNGPLVKKGNLDIDPLTGKLTWDSPTLAGNFNLCILVTEYRKDPLTNSWIVVGEVLRDMQITIEVCTNEPPVFKELEDVCVNAGDTIVHQIVACDSSGQTITLTAVGEPLELADSSAFFPQGIAMLDTVKADFIWNTSCDHIRAKPYKMDYKAEDNDDNSLVNFASAFYTVVGPAPENVSVTSAQNTAKIAWSPSSCDTNIVGYNIYRRIDSSQFVPDHCETGIPSQYGFTLIGSTTGFTSTSFTDDDNGQGLIHGQLYCYRIVAIYDEDAEGYASLEACVELEKDVPVITRATVVSTDFSNGIDSIRWAKPTELDTSVQFPGPYKYVVYVSEGNGGATDYYGETPERPRISDLDTLFEVSGLNTAEKEYSFKVELQSNGNVVGSTHHAASVFLELWPSDNALTLRWDEKVPWSNDQYVIHKLIGSDFVAIDTVNAPPYVDGGLTNGKEYSYFITSFGRYSTNGFPDPIVNNSQIAVGIPVDTVAPCPPQNPNIRSECTLYSNELWWENPNKTCADDVIEYRVYRNKVLGEPYELVAVLSNVEDTSILFDNLESVAGCYTITAVDSFQNESGYSERLCVDNCPEYELPNVITPGGDGLNDFFRPFPYRYVESIQLSIYNRWGQLVFETTDPDINWDGSYILNGKQLKSGVYFYTCLVNEIRLSGIEQRTLQGHLTIINQGETNPTN